MEQTGLTLGSLFDGIGGWQIAAVRAGIKPLWSSEIAPFPAAVTAKHFPDTVQLGDITKLDGAMLSPVDIVCAGSPCQGLSLAGKRKGLNDERSGLFIKSVELVRRMRDITNGKYPRFFVWENVFGAFSCNKGRDFQAVLSEIGQTDVPMPRNGRWAPAGLAGLPECDIAWRTLDAQFWGVPQRRRRIFLVADFAEKNRCAAEVLFVEQSMPGDLEESGTAGKDASAVAKNRARTSSWCIAGNVINRKDKNGGNHLGIDENVSFTLNTKDRHAVFTENDVYCLQGSMIGRSEKNGPQGSGINKNVSFTLNTIDHHAVCAPNEKTYSAQAIGHIVESEKSSTLAARDYKSPRNFVEYSKQELASGKPCTGTLLANASTKLWSGDQEAFSGNYFVIDKQQEVPLYDISHRNDGVREIPKGACNTLVARMGTGGGNVAVLNEADRQKTDDAQTIRRLTVTECERLQGLSDGYTDVPVNGKPASERDRLMAIGNGMSQPCADFVLRQIVLTIKAQEECNGGARSCPVLEMGRR